MTAKRKLIKSRKRFNLIKQTLGSLARHEMLGELLARGTKIESSCGDRYEVVAVEELHHAFSKGTVDALEEFIFNFLDDTAWQALKTQLPKTVKSRISRKITRKRTSEKDLDVWTQRAMRSGYE